MHTQSYTYKNISDVELALPGIGIIKPGEIVEVDEPINNVNFELTGAGDTSGRKKIINETETK